MKRRDENRVVQSWTVRLNQITQRSRAGGAQPGVSTEGVVADNRLSFLPLLVTLVLSVFLTGAAPTDTGRLKVVRTSPTGALGQPIKVNWVGSATASHTIKTVAKQEFSVPAGWYQVSCSPTAGQGRAHSSTVHVSSGGTTLVRCFFTREVEAPVAQITSEPEAASLDSIFKANGPSLQKFKQVRLGARGKKGRGGIRSASPPIAAGRIALSTRRHGAPAHASLFASGDLGSADGNTENYDRVTENEFKAVTDSPLSTVSIDVDTAAYANSRRFIEQMHRLPPKDAVRIEELINYFDYDYAQPEGEHPFAIHTEVSVAPWNPKNRLVHIGLQGKEIDMSKAPPSNLVFLIDVSGSMRSANKLPLLVQGFKMLVNRLRPEDRVAIVVYASRQGLLLPSTSGAEKGKIIAALDGLSAGGSTAGGAGIKLAYKTARKNFIKGGTNRVILATDGDFNVGVSSTAALERLVETERDSDVFLTILGFGSGNYKDARMETLSNKGNGNAAYIDSILEARKVLVNEMGGTLVTIAKDVKIQLEFNPAKVKGYRLIGYENRMLAAKDFNDDKKDAGELGAGHTVTALYEIIPAGSDEAIAGVDPLKYQSRKISDAAKSSPELLTVKLRYKKPTGKKSILVSQPLIDHEVALAKTSNAFRFSTAVAEFGMLLRQSKHRGDASYSAMIERAQSALGADKQGYRTSFVQLARKAQALAGVAQGVDDKGNSTCTPHGPCPQQIAR